MVLILLLKILTYREQSMQSRAHTINSCATGKQNAILNTYNLIVNSAGFHC